MGIRRIHIFPDPILSKISAPVEFGKDNVIRIVRDLVDTLNASPGVGLAAPQIGILKRVCIVNLGRKPPRKKEKPPPNPKGLIILINPVITKGGGKQICREGCLSVPDLLGNVQRYQTVTIQYRSLTGMLKVIHSEGFESVALQHEMDHLDGILFLDRISNIKTDVFRRKQIS